MTQKGGFGHEEVSRDEFFEYFSNFSAAISDDKYFETILQQTFRLNQETSLHSNYAGGSKRVFEPDHKKGYLQDHHRNVVSGGSVAANAPYGTFAEPDQSVRSRPQSQYQQSASFNIFKPLQGQAQFEVKEIAPKQVTPVQVQKVESNGKHAGSFMVIRNKVLARGSVNQYFKKRLRSFDRSSLGTVSLQEFSRVFHDLRLQIGEQDIQEVFKQFEVQESGVMNYDGLVKAIQGTMSQRKFNVLMSVFDCFSKQNQQVKLDEIRDCFNSSKHPDVKMNKKREEDVYSEFLDTFEDNHKLYTGEDYSKNNLVSFEEFINYHNNISALVEDDQLFEQYVQGVWPSTSTTTKGRRF